MSYRSSLPRQIGLKIEKVPGNIPEDLITKITPKEFLALLISLIEFLDPSCSINKQFLASVKRMGCRTHFYLYQWISITVCPLNFIICFDSRSGYKREITRRVVKYNFPIVWMNIFSHAIKIVFSSIQNGRQK